MFSLNKVLLRDGNPADWRRGVSVLLDDGSGRSAHVVRPIFSGAVFRYVDDIRSRPSRFPRHKSISFPAMNQPLARFQVYVLFLLLLTATTVTAFISSHPIQ